MATDPSVKRWRSTRKSMRESLGLKKRAVSSDGTVADRPSPLKALFDDYNIVSGYSTSDRKVAKVRERLLSGGFQIFKDADVRYALNTLYASGDPDLAFELLEIIENSDAGKVEPYQPETVLLGADNNEGVTCYLDATLFAMFARLEDFEAILYHTFSDSPRRRLVVLIRMWVNLLRKGKPITVNFTRQLQNALADCGWQEAASKEQQDASEAFNFITDVLDLPRLTLKKDMFHQGKADQDDHKYTNERTIDVGIPDPKPGKQITLEDCMLQYFDERVYVERQRETTARRNTLGSSPALVAQLLGTDEKPGKALHIDISEVPDSTPVTPIDSKVMFDGRPQLLATAGRSSSIFGEKKIRAHERVLSPTRQNSLPSSRKRSSTIGKTVKMPAFQFFRLIPWYTEGNPNSDIQVAQHFETKRPTVGICLKRFGQKSDGTFYKRSEKIDIPLETGIPEFLHDDDFSEERFPNHKFMLSLQSFICHRGATIQRGHYRSYVRATRPETDMSAMDPDRVLAQNRGSEPWLRFDDLESPKVRFVNINSELSTECPYMLFYKIVLRDEDVAAGRVSIDGRPPSYGSDSSSHVITEKEINRARSSAGSIAERIVVPSVVVGAAHESVQGPEKRSGSIGAPEGNALTFLESEPTKLRAQSMFTDLDNASKDTGPSVTVPAKSEESHSNSTTGSLSRGIGSLFKPRGHRRDRSSVDTGKTSVDLERTFERKPATAEPGQEEVLHRHPIVPASDAPQSIPASEFAMRESHNELGHSHGQGREKPSHKRDRSLGDRWRLHSDRQDRECSVM